MLSQQTIPTGCDLEQLYYNYLAMHHAEPNLRVREIAERLEVSEVELLACRKDIWVVRLQPQFMDLIKALETVGEVMALTRNDQAVHERKGVYSHVSFSGGGMGLVLTPEIDLRLFMFNWQFGFAAEENGRQSLQFFNRHGIAVHKIYSTENTDMNAWLNLVDRFQQDSIEPLTVESAVVIAPADAPPLRFDQDKFRQDWEALRDVHDYHGMLRKHGLTRTQALKQIGTRWAKPLNSDAIEHALTLAAQQHQEIMVFVGNSGCIQIHTGCVEKLMTVRGWFNVLDERFNLHLKTAEFAQTWLIQRPTADGVITSIEAFNSQGNSVITLFGKRKPGQSESRHWRELVAAVELTKTQPEVAQ